MVELERQGELTRTEIATFLREFADELDVDASARDGDSVHETSGEPAPTMEHEAGTEPTRTEAGEHADDRRRTDERNDVERVTESERNADRITFVVGGDSATVTVPHTLDFEVEVESRSPMMSGGVSQQVGLDLSWEVEDQENRELRGDDIEVG